MREKYLNLIKTFTPQQLVFIDESGCQLGMDRRYARSEKGERAHCTKPFYKGEQINIIGAIDLKKVRCMFSVDGTVNGDVFELFVSKILLPTLRKGDLVILDNLPAHKMARVRKLIESTGAAIQFLPPYSPDLNPIELLWYKLKEVIRSFSPRTTQAFNKAFDAALAKISRNDLDGWFRHCGCLGQTK